MAVKAYNPFNDRLDKTSDTGVKEVSSLGTPPVEVPLSHRGIEETDFHYRRLFSERNLPSDVWDKVMFELQRLRHLSLFGPESAMVKTYLENILNIPWEEGFCGEDQDINRSPRILKALHDINLTQVQASLDGEHYGLSDAKERVLEFLAVQKLTQRPQGTILCLVGPPGVGKTSFANSIATSMDRPYAYVSLGGVQDPAEIRGYRRTTPGAQPGRILQAIQQTGSLSPVIVLDEMDKMVSTHYGDPESAILDVLDFNRNHAYTDHYMEVPVDLSRVLFIATANSLYGVSRALRDRLEIIPISGYTDFEKLAIADRFLFPRLLKSHGLSNEQLRIREDVMTRLIHAYTREAGVRDLERTLAKLCRKAAIAVVGNEQSQINLRDEASLRKYLGVERFTLEPCSPLPAVGVVNGLAWTGDGGDMLQIESNRLEGKGKLTLTGSIGHVMLESAQAALTFIRSHPESLGLSRDLLESSDYHIHLPDGATPKDGPSAGMALAVSIISALRGVAVRPQVALTGEITIRGRVLPVGGLKEKCLAALRLNFQTVLFPEGNQKDLAELPEELRSRLTFIPVKTLQEALPHVLLEEEPAETGHPSITQPSVPKAARRAMAKRPSGQKKRPLGAKKI